MSTFATVHNGGNPTPPPRPVRPEPPGEITTVWRSGEVWREYPNGRAKQLPDIDPLPVAKP